MSNTFQGLKSDLLLTRNADFRTLRKKNFGFTVLPNANRKNFFLLFSGNVKSEAECPYYSTKPITYV